MSTTKPKNPPAKGGLSLYANLLDPSSSTNNTDGSTISRAPVVFQQPGDSSTTSAQEDAAVAAKKQISAAALRFQPARRPQVTAQKAKAKAAGFARAIPAASIGGAGKVTGVSGGNTSSSEAAATVTASSTNGNVGPNAIHQPQLPAAKATLADWTATNNEDDDNVNGFYQGEKRQRGGRKKRKKGNKGGEVMLVVQNWDDIYDPTRPNSYEEYMNSDEKRREIREWKEKLYAHRRARRRDSISSSSDREDRGRPVKSFAPPTNYSFAPPPLTDTTENTLRAESEPSPAEAADIANDTTGEDAYLRRLRLSNAPSQQTGLQEAREPPRPLSPPSQGVRPSTSTTASPSEIPSQLQTQPPPPPPPPPPSVPLSDTLPQYQPPQQESFPPIPPTAPATSTATATISRAPVRYDLPAAPAEIEVSQDDLDASLARDIKNDSNNITAEAKNARDNQEEQQIPEPAQAPRSNRPGQAGFAERYMASQGWKRGEGLGASGSGIINPLRVQVEKQKQRSDADGGGFVGPGGKGKIVGGGKRKKMTTTTTTEAGAEVEEKEEYGKFGPMSEVVIAKGMLVSMDVDAEIANGLLQELGEECEAKYGRLVRVFINRESTEDSPPVFFHFTTALSALRAVNALHGRVFNGNTITAKFFDAERFEKDSFE